MKRTTACVVACVLGLGLLARTAPAQKAPANNPYLNPEQAADSRRVRSDQANGKLKADVAKLLADTKAGKRSVLPTQQFPSPHRNNLSKTAKIGIIVGVAVVVLAIIVWKSAKYDCESRCVL